MTTELNPIAEVRRLADAMFDGNLDPAGIARLENLVDHSNECLHAYVERLDFHGELLDQGDPHSNKQAAMLVLQDITDARVGKADTSHRYLLAVSAVAVMTVCGFMSWLIWGAGLHPKPLGNIAHMTDDATSSRGTLELGQVIRKGATFSVDDGVLSLELGNVMIDLLGPAELRLNDLKQVQLQRGTLTARVQPGGEGFTVRTPDAEVIDLGTEFSVRYHSQQGTDVSVRRGRARASLLDTNGLPSKVLELTAHRAARFHRPHSQLTELLFEPEPFDQIDRTRGMIRSVSGQLRTMTEPPESLLSEKTTTPNHMLILPERQNVVLEADLEIETLTGRMQIPAGTTVSSYLVHYDPTTSASFAPRGSITFFGKIAAAIVGTDTLQKTDALLGFPETAYETRRSRGLEQDDTIRISDDQRTVSFFFRMESPEYQDQVRILVVDH